LNNKFRCAQNINLAVVALDSTNASNLIYIPTTHHQRRWTILYRVLTPIASKHNGYCKLENINKLIIARLQWTKQANRVNGPNSNELKHSSVKLNPAPVKGTKSHHPSLLSSLEFCDLSICPVLLNLLCSFCMLSCEPLLWFVNMSIDFELLWCVCTFCSILVQRLCLNIDCWLSYRWLPIFFL